MSGPKGRGPTSTDPTANKQGIAMNRALAIAIGALIAAASLASSANAADTSLVRRALVGPMKDIQEVVFALRLPYKDGHWYANIGYYCDDETHKARAGDGGPDVGKLCKLNLRTGEVKTLVDAPGGSVRDPQLHYDGRKILFSFRKPDTDYYHLYEINVDGSGLRQITDGPFDDYEPCYLPDGDLVFVSTRCRCWVNCWVTQVGVLHRCDASGGNIQRISFNGEHDNTPWVMPDGRVLYMRWEYTDRSQVEFHHLWTVNPDGTNPSIFFGNLHPGIVMLDAKPIPGTDNVLASFSPGHGIRDHKGVATVVSPKAGPDSEPSARELLKALIEDPYPVSAHCFLAAREKQIVVIDDTGAIAPLWTHRGEGDVREPRPLVERPREPVIPPRVHEGQPTGRLILADVYNSRNLGGVRRGEIKKLLVLEPLPKQVNFSGGTDLTSWLGTFTLERVLGTVPVEADGSACFEVPANRPVFFVALDDKDLSVKRMHSFTTVRPGETTSCIGCHEQRTHAPDPAKTSDLLAMRRAPSRIEPFEGIPDVLDFTRDIQPILDNHCVECHNYQRHDGRAILAGDLGPHWSHSYFSLLAHRQVSDGRNGLGNYPPRTIGSSASPLLKKLEIAGVQTRPALRSEGECRGARVSPKEWRTVWMWIESGAPYAGSYAGLRNAEQQDLANAACGKVFGQGNAILNSRCVSCHHEMPFGPDSAMPLPTQASEARKLRGPNRPLGAYERVVAENDPVARFGSSILVNFTHPEFSPLLLGPLAKEAGGWGSCPAVFKDTHDPDYQKLLAAIRNGKAVWSESRWGEAGFKPNRQYVREMKRYGVLPAMFDLAKDPIDVFETDQAYWRTFWYRPEQVPMARY